MKHASAITDHAHTHTRLDTIAPASIDEATDNRQTDRQRQRKKLIRGEKRVRYTINTIITDAIVSHFFFLTSAATIMSLRCVKVFLSSS